MALGVVLAEHSIQPCARQLHSTPEDVKECQESIKNLGIGSESAGKTSTRVQDAKAKSEKSATKPIIVPIVLKMTDFDHKALLEKWVSRRSVDGKFLTKDQKSLISNLKTIQDYLCSFESQGTTVVNIFATTFPQTLEWLNNHILQCIEAGSPQSNTGNNIARFVDFFLGAMSH